MKKIIITIFFYFLLIINCFSNEYIFKKLVDLDSPWGSSFISNEELIITEKSGKIIIVNIKNKKSKIVNHNLNFKEHGQGGLLDIIYNEGYVWVSYTEDRSNDLDDWLTSTSIAKAKFENDKLFFKNIFQANPPINSRYHFGSRITIKDKYLFA